MNNINLFIFFLLTFVFVPNMKGDAQILDKEAYYEAMSSNKISELNAQMELLQNSSSVDKEAFEGALLMKKAGLTTSLRDKFNFFKSGRTKLELEIQRHSDNIEYRFLRVMIQENAPQIVHYKNELMTDCPLIKNAFNKLPPSLQQSILNYSKVSKLLISKELQTNGR